MSVVNNNLSALGWEALWQQTMDDNQLLGNEIESGNSNGKEKIVSIQRTRETKKRQQRIHLDKDFTAHNNDTDICMAKFYVWDPQKLEVVEVEPRTYCQQLVEVKVLVLVVHMYQYQYVN